MNAISGPVLRYHGSVVELRRALRKHRMAVRPAQPSANLGDDAARRTMQRMLRQAEIRTIRSMILGRAARRGGGAA